MSVFVAQLRREIWEHPVFYIAPIAIGGIMTALSTLVFLGNGGSGRGIRVMVQGLDVADAGRADAGVTIALLSFLPAFALPLTVIVGFYLLECLSTERRDRSILFFRSLPVSDLTTVLSKLVTASLVAPALALAALIVTQLSVLIITSIAFALGDAGAAALWRPSRLLSIWALGIYGAIAFALWFAPVHCFLLAVSAWARRATLVWAASPLFLMLLERAFTGQTLLGQLLGAYTRGFWATAFAHRFRVSIGDEAAVAAAVADSDLESLSNIWGWMDPVGLVTSPMLWAGLLVATGFGAGAVVLRRYRDDS